MIAGYCTKFTITNTYDRLGRWQNDQAGRYLLRRYITIINLAQTYIHTNVLKLKCVCLYMSISVTADQISNIIRAGFTTS